jgi:hypothetical protein
MLSQDHFVSVSRKLSNSFKLMKIGFISQSVPGHFHPMSAVARQLESRNHDIVVLSLPAMEPFARAANLPFIWEKSYEPAVGLPRNHHPAVPDATSQNLGWAGLQAFRYGKMNWLANATKSTLTIRAIKTNLARSLQHSC